MKSEDKNIAGKIKKPTPAQLRWLKAIAEGRVRRVGHSWVNGLSNSRGQPSKSTYVMTLSLHDAGWIDHEKRNDGFIEYKIILTPAGQAQIAEKKDAANG